MKFYQNIRFTRESTREIVRIRINVNHNGLSVNVVDGENSRFGFTTPQRINDTLRDLRRLEEQGDIRNLEYSEENEIVEVNGTFFERSELTRDFPITAELVGEGFNEVLKIGEDVIPVLELSSLGKKLIRNLRHGIKATIKIDSITLNNLRHGFRS